MRRFLWVIVAGVVALGLMSTYAHAEGYISIGAGQSFSGSVNDYEAEQCIGFIFCDNVVVQSGSDLDTDSALALGGKIGYFVDTPSLAWLGFEFQYFQRKLNVSRQAWSVNGSQTSVMVPTLPFNGQAEIEMDALKTFAFFLMFRIPPKIVDEYLLGRMEPYFGFGFSVNQVEIGPMRLFDSAGNPVSTNLFNESTVGLGFVISLGMNFKIHDRWKLYGEYKHAEAFFPFPFTTLNDFDLQTSGPELHPSLDITDNIFMFGVTFTFGSTGS